MIEVARHAPNHHRTEPARFYLLSDINIKKVGKLFGEVVAGDRSNLELCDKGKRKEKEWGNAPGLLVVTCHTDLSSPLVCKNPEVIDEDYATCCCIVQNLLLLMEAEGIASKWSTGQVWKHQDFNQAIGLQSPEFEKVVALLFYGYSAQEVPDRRLTPMAEHLKT